MPPRHFSAGVTGLRPVSSRMTRRSSSSKWRWALKTSGARSFLDRSPAGRIRLGPGLPGRPLRRGRPGLGARASRRDPGPAPVVVLAPAIAAHHPQWRSGAVGGNDRMQAIGLARATVVFEQFAGAIRTQLGHQSLSLVSSCPSCLWCSFVPFVPFMSLVFLRALCVLCALCVQRPDASRSAPRPRSARTWPARDSTRSRASTGAHRRARST